MRRTIALALTMLFCWTPIAPFFAPDAEANLPACCRRHGKHHCMMRAMERLGGRPSGVASVSENCPCPPTGACAIHAQIYKPESQETFPARVGVDPLRAPQIQSLFRLAAQRSHPKRGPPTSLA
jgi:hypothetical protein